MNNPTADANKNEAAPASQGGQQPIPVNLTEPKPESIRPKDDTAQAPKTFRPMERFMAWWRNPDRPWSRRKGEAAKWTDKAIVVLTAGIVFLAFMQWLEMHDSGMQTDRIITADERIAKAMEDSVSQAKTSFDAANKQAILSQRAWMSAGIQINAPKDVTGNVPETLLEVGKQIDVKIAHKNTGRTPALNVKIVTQRTGIGRDKHGVFPIPTLTLKNDGT